jgi:hypothetical protein
VSDAICSEIIDYFCLFVSIFQLSENMNEAIGEGKQISLVIYIAFILYELPYKFRE